MTRSGIIFLIVIILNTLIAAGYLIWYLIFKKDTDNRKQYVMHTVIMLICPIVGILYFLTAFLKYHFIKFGERDLTDVEFSKKRHTPRIKADEERERNIVSLEESILVSDREKKRKNMLNVLLGETDESFSAIALATILSSVERTSKIFSLIDLFSICALVGFALLFAFLSSSFTISALANSFNSSTSTSLVPSITAITSFKNSLFVIIKPLSCVGHNPFFNFGKFLSFLYCIFIISYLKEFVKNFFKFF